MYSYLKPTKKPNNDKTDFINMSLDAHTFPQEVYFPPGVSLTFLNSLLIFGQRMKRAEHYKKLCRIGGLIQKISVVV